MKHCDKKAVTVNVTNQCNLRCGYCMASSADEQANPYTIPLDFAKCGIHDSIHGYPTGVEASIIRFFSPGEPTQRMDIIKECVEYARSLNSDIQIELQTNGLFPSPEDTKWIANNIDVVWFSLDGPPEINDIQRPDAYGVGRTLEIEKNLSIVSQNTTVGVRATVVEETIQHQDRLVQYYYEKGVTNLGLNPVIRQIKRKDQGKNEVTKIGIMEFAKGFLKADETAKELGVILSSSLTFNFDEKTDIACRCLIPMPQLNPDTSVSSCDMALYEDTKKELQCFLYGRWNQKSGKIEYDRTKISHLRNRTGHTIKACSKCEVRDYCAGGCAGRIAYQTGDIYAVIPEYCAAIKYLARKMRLGRKMFEVTHP